MDAAKDKSDHEKKKSSTNFWSEYNTLRILWTKLDHEKKGDWFYDITIWCRKAVSYNASKIRVKYAYFSRVKVRGEI